MCAGFFLWFGLGFFVCVLGVVGSSACGLVFVWRCLACACMLFGVCNYVLYRAL